MDPRSITLHIVANPFEPWRDRKTLEVAHVPGMRAIEYLDGLIPEQIEGCRTVVEVNTVTNGHAAVLQPGDIVTCYQLPGAAAAAPVAGEIAMGWLASMMILAMVGIGIGLLISALTPRPKYDSTDAAGGFDTLATYGWDTGANQSKEGISLPILYGTRRVTPPVIEHHVTYNDNGDESLNVLLSLCEGGRGAGAGGTDTLEIAQVGASDAVYVNGSHYANYLTPGLITSASDLTINRCVNGLATAGPTLSGSSAARAFDGSVSTAWGSSQSNQLGWVAYNFGAGVYIKATKYKFDGYVSGTVAVAKSWRVQGSHDGTTWTTVDTRTNVNVNTVLVLTEYTITGNTVFYQYYKLDITAHQDGSVGDMVVAEFQIYGYADVETTGIAVAFREGTNTQAVIDEFTSTRCNMPVGKYLDVDWFTFPTGAGAGATLLGLYFSFPQGLYKINSTTGAIETESIAIAAEYRTVSSTGTAGAWTAFTGSPWTFSNFTSNEYKVSKEEIGLGAYRYDVRVKFNAAPTVDRYRFNRCVWDYLTEGVTDDFAYPNTALMGLYMRATGVLNGGFPQIEATLSRPYVLVDIAGTLTAKPATNPAWACYDLLVNPAYGGLVDTSRVILSEFTAWAAFCDNMRSFSAWQVTHAYAVGDKVRKAAAGNGYYYEVTATAGTGTSAGTEPTWPTVVGDSIIDNAGANQVTWICRLNHVTCNIYFDSAMTLREALASTSQIGRGTVITRGVMFGVVVDCEASAVQLFSAGNIIEKTFKAEFSSKANLINAVEVTFFDETRDYSRQIITMEDPDSNDADFISQSSQVTMHGITDRNMAAAHGAFLLNCNRLLKRVVSFDVGVDAIACQVGDVVKVQNDVPRWGLAGGRVVSATSNTVTLDKAVTLQSGTTYKVLVRHADDSMETAELAAVGSPTTSAAWTLKTATTWAVTPAANDVYALGVTALETKLFRIVRISRSQQQTRKLTALEYDALVYA